MSEECTGACMHFIFNPVINYSIFEGEYLSGMASVYKCLSMQPCAPETIMFKHWDGVATGWNRKASFGYLFIYYICNARMGTMKCEPEAQIVGC